MTAPGAWRSIGPTTSVMEVPGGMLVREMQYAGGASGFNPTGVGMGGATIQPLTVSTSICFVPWPPRWAAFDLGHKSPEAAMRRWIEDAERKAGGG